MFAINSNKYSDDLRTPTNKNKSHLAIEDARYFAREERSDPRFASRFRFDRLESLFGVKIGRMQVGDRVLMKWEEGIRYL